MSDRPTFNTTSSGWGIFRLLGYERSFQVSTELPASSKTGSVNTPRVQAQSLCHAYRREIYRAPTAAHTAVSDRKPRDSPAIDVKHFDTGVVALPALVLLHVHGDNGTVVVEAVVAGAEA
jgi:hypothetical protein